MKHTPAFFNLNLVKQKSDPTLCPRIECALLQHRHDADQIDYYFYARVSDINEWNKNKFIKNLVVTEDKSGNEKSYIITAVAPLAKMLFLHKQPYVCSLQGDYVVKQLTQNRMQGP